MMFKKCLVLACVASVALAQQAASIFCQARYFTNIATCVLGMKECNTVESFSSCVCSNTGNKPSLRLCLVALLASPDFKGVLYAADIQRFEFQEGDAEAVIQGYPGQENLQGNPKEVAPQANPKEEAPQANPKEGTPQANPKEEAPQANPKEEAQQGNHGQEL
jgi:hypothetical protein